MVGGAEHDTHGPATLDVGGELQANVEGPAGDELDAAGQVPLDEDLEPWLDLGLEGTSGSELLARAKTTLSGIPAIVMTAEHELDLATPLAERGSYTGHAAEIRGARRDLERARGR